MTPVNVKHYPKRGPGDPVLGILIDMHTVHKSAMVAALQRHGVVFDPSRETTDFPFNLSPGQRIEIECDTHKDGLAMLRYYGPLQTLKPTPAAKPYVDEDDDDEL